MKIEKILEPCDFEKSWEVKQALIDNGWCGHYEFSSHGEKFVTQAFTKGNNYCHIFRNVDGTLCGMGWIHIQFYKRGKYGKKIWARSVKGWGY